RWPRRPPAGVARRATRRRGATRARSASTSPTADPTGAQHPGPRGLATCHALPMTKGGPSANLDVAGCTTATRDHLADARVAAESFLDHHPGSRFTIVVVDGD